MTPIVAIIAPGNMGAAMARRLHEHKVTVLTALAGRSEASIKRAREAGMSAVDERALAEADFLLSIVPPGEALALARRLAGVLTAANKKPIYVECNPAYYCVDQLKDKSLIMRLDLISDAY